MDVLVDFTGSRLAELRIQTQHYFTPPQPPRPLFHTLTYQDRIPGVSVSSGCG